MFNEKISESVEDGDRTFGIAGSSWTNGFNLKCTNAGGHQLLLVFRVPDTDERQSRRFDWGAALLSIVLFFAAMMGHLLWPKVLMIYLLVRCHSGIFEASYKRWHWVEHQAAFWLEGLGKQAFDSINPISMRCGSMLIIAQGLTLSSFAMVFRDYGLWALPLLVSAATAWFKRTDLGRHVFCRWRLLGVLMFVIAWPADILGCIFQRLIFMCRPTAQHREWAHLWAQHAAPVIAAFIEEDPSVCVIVPLMRHFSEIPE